MKPKTILILVIVALAAALIAMNSGPVTIQLLFWPIRVPTFILVPTILLVGFALGYLAAKLSGRGGK
ncbi:MAG: LapA family protein [Candidatus Aminicenantes bacterium]|nr:LapA family protein [Candidatus Aminicenantes bacterium]